MCLRFTNPGVRPAQVIVEPEGESGHPDQVRAVKINAARLARQLRLVPAGMGPKAHDRYVKRVLCENILEKTMKKSKQFVGTT